VSIIAAIIAAAAIRPRRYDFSVCAVALAAPDTGTTRTAALESIVFGLDRTPAILFVERAADLTADDPAYYGTDDGCSDTAAATTNRTAEKTPGQCANT